MASLFGTIQQSANALGVAQIGLQVVGNNIGNTNTEGYIRQELQQASAPGTRQGGLILGHGVRPTGIVQKVDQQLVERMINAKNALSSAETLETAYNQLEELTVDLNGGGLSNQLSLFSNALQELSTQPNDPSLRDFVILQGETLAGAIRRNREDTFARAELYNGNLDAAVDEINLLTDRIAQLNVEIATIEGGTNSDATGLRDQRYLDLEKLAEYVNVNFQEQENGVMSIFVGGDYLVSGGNSREVYSAYDPESEGTEIRIRETDSPLDASGGKVAAAKAARDEVFGKYVKELDEMAAGLIRAVNEIHSDGQGSSGFQTLKATTLTDANVPLKDAGLAFVPRNGSFDLNVVDENGKVISTNRIEVRILGQVTDSTISSIAADIDAIDGLNASVDANGLVTINTDAPTAGFTFHNDNSGFLAAAGINTFFNGKNGFDIAINPMLKGNPDLLAISKTGINEDTEALTQLIGVIDRPYDHLDGHSIRETYERTLTDMAQQVSVQKGAAEGLGNFYDTLRSQHLAISGVNIDEEAIKMIAYQRSFQASSRVITTANEMLDILMSL